VGRRHNNLSAISLYTGAGGLDLGFEAAGFETRVAGEMDDDCVTTIRANRDWPVMHRSIHEISSEEILSIADLDPGEADVLIGGPPCQPFSKCGYWANGDAARLVDPRATTVEAFLRALRDSPFEVVIDGKKLLRSGLAEAVKQALLKQGRELVDRAKKGIEGALQR
jgi:site-specific DNA-cytosine methylase